MFYYTNFLSERTQGALLILAMLSWEYVRTGEGGNKKEIEKLTGLSNGIVNNHISCLLSMGLVEFHKRKLYPAAKLTSASLYDLIEYTDGWVHLGNANMENISGNAAARIFIASCECKIRKGIYDYLQSIRLSSLLCVRDEAFGKDSRALEATGSSMSARKAERVEPGICFYEPGSGKRSIHTSAKIASGIGNQRKTR